MVRVIGTSLDNNYRDDLNYNFGLLSSAIENIQNGSGSDKDAILEMIDNLQRQINAIVGGDIEDLLNRVNQAIIEADRAAKRAEKATSESEIATQLANAAAALANANAIVAEQAAIRAEKISNEMVILKEETKVAKDDAIKASNNINAVLPNVQGLENKKIWNSGELYKKNNFVIHQGNGYMALKESIGATPPIPPNYSNEYWSIYTERGLTGDTGTGLNVLGVLNNVVELPLTGEKGDAYFINGEIYVWSVDTNKWVNGGNVKGEKGDPGDVTQVEIGINRYNLETTETSQRSWRIPLVTFNPTKDGFFVIRNTTFLDPSMYAIEEKSDGLYVTLKIPAIEEVSENNLSVIIFKNKAIIPENTFDGSLLTNESVTLPKLSEDIQKTLSNVDTIATDFAERLDDFEKQSDKNVYTRRSKMRTIAHRGFSAAYPENSIPAFVGAAKAGFYGIECDISSTSDGVWVVMHNDTVDAYTNGTGNVNELTYDYIKNLKIDNGANIAKYPNLKVPTLDDYLQICKSYNLLPLIEVKKAANDAHYQSLIESIINWGFEYKCIVLSLKWNPLQKIRELNKNIKLSFNTALNEIDVISKGLQPNCAITLAYANITKEAIEKSHNMNFEVIAIIIDDYNDAEKYANIGADYLVTNRIAEVF